VIYRGQLRKVLPNISKQFSRRFYTDFTTLRTRLHDCNRRRGATTGLWNPTDQGLPTASWLASRFEIKFSDKFCKGGLINLWAMLLGYLVAPLRR